MNIEKYHNKNGKLISARVSVYIGKDSEGKEIRSKKTIKVPFGMSPSKAEKYIISEAVMFEQKCKADAFYNGDITFADYSKRVLETKVFEGLKKSTLARYDELLGRINDAIGYCPLNKIKAMTLNNFYVELAKPGTNLKTGGGLSPKTIREHHNLISSVLSFAVDDELIPNNPALKARPPKIKRKKIDALSADELHKVLKYADEEPIKWRLMIYILAATGGRRGEVLGIEWKSVDFENSTIHICNTILYTPKNGIYADTPKTKKSNRYIKLPDSIMEMLREYQEWQKAEEEKYGDAYYRTDYVFTKLLGGPMHPDSVTDFLRKFSERHGLRHIYPHLFRHSAASVLIAEHVDPATVSGYLGHATTSITMDIYTHSFSEEMAKASDILGEKLIE